MDSTAATAAAAAIAATDFNDAASALVSYDLLECDNLNCSNKSVRKKCGRCHCLYYCSTDCQREHWDEHKAECVDFGQLAAEKLVKKPPPLRFVSDNDLDGIKCGLCQKADDNVEIPVLIPDCGHSFCFLCLKNDVYKQRHENNGEEEKNDDSKTSACHCPLCKKSIAGLATNESSLDDILMDRYDYYIDRARREDTTDEEKKNLLFLANQVLKTVLLALERTPDDNWYDDAVVPREKYVQALIRGADLDLLLDDAKMALKKMEDLVKGETVFQMHRLESIISDFDDKDGPNEKKLILDLVTSIRVHGLTFSAFFEAKEFVGLRRMFDIGMAKAKFYEALEDWEAARNEYQPLMHYFYRNADSHPRKFTREQESTLLMRVTELEAKRGDKRSALNCASLVASIQFTRSTPGIHLKLASVLKDLGENEDAREAMSRGLAYEAPWDDENMAKNVDQYTDLSKEILEKEELRKKEEEFFNVWGEVLIVVDATSTKNRTVSWETIKEKTYDIFGAIDSDDEGDDDEIAEEIQEETARKLQTAAVAALSISLDESVNQESYSESETGDDETLVEESALSGSNGGDRSILPSYDHIKLTKDALKDVENLDSKYREFFVRRVEDLAAGRRSRIMKKRLVGCKRDIWETYLEQKSGHRILWTADKEELVIWYVARHKKVSKLIEMIDKADGRSSRRLAQGLTPASQLIEISTKIMQAAHHENGGGEDRIYLDPLSDTPLKLHKVGRDEIPKLMAAGTGWKPPLFLTREERQIVEQEGTTLLLGRSGTGKTVCICSRIHYDRHHAATGKSFAQLFVARSQRICNYVQDTVGTEYDEKDGNLRRIHYRRFKKFAELCLESLQGEAENGLSFDWTRRVDFSRFKRDFSWVNDYKLADDSKLDPLIIWTQIRSYVKGSIEALIKRDSDYLELSEYLDMTAFSSSRCRLPKTQRIAAYNAFQLYEEEKNTKKLWDDCDLIAALHRAFDEARRCGTLPEELLFDRVYVDEIQDYTQSEIALFFKLCERGYLFLAGDPAQSVVEGVEFRFEEVRSVVFKLLPKKIQEDRVKRTRYIPTRPSKVTVNFRSHAGILNVAREVLDRLFEAFPKSAPELGKDEGVFLGPRPGLFENVSEERLLELVSKIDGVVVLAHRDEDVERLTAKVGDGVVVLSIRDSKGLEFTDVILVDFFKGLSKKHQTPWRELLRDGSDVSKFQDKYPEIETHLKQLYTAITRCSMRFFVAETGRSIAGEAFMKWIRRKDLASKQNVVEVEKMTKTHDQWISTGMDHAKTAEAMEDFKRAKFWLDKAMFCFQQAENTELQVKVSTHLSSLRLREELYFRKQNDDDVRDNNDDEDETSYEERAVDILAKLAKEGLLAEAAKLCYAIMPLLGEYARDSLQQRLVPKLPTVDD